MSSNIGNRTAAENKGGGQLMAGILVGMVIGVAIAAGMAWYLMKSPTPFLRKAKLPDQASAVSAPQNLPPVIADHGENDKPRFEFYKVLTEKQDTTIVMPAKPTGKAKILESKHANGYEPHLLQAGSFQSVDDAEKLRAKLALLGVEANIQSASIPDKGVWYRVRLGPYKTADEINRARSFLLQNGVESTPMRSQ